MTDWLKVASDSFEASTSYIDANYRKQFERNIALFQSRHPVGSKYNSTAYKHRSKLFRPKTKSVVRKNEAAAAAAFFANIDVVTIEPENDADPAQVISAELMNEILNYRLTKTIPWYMILLGALQEAQVIGVVASYQYWKYREKEVTSYEPMVIDGIPVMSPEGEPYFEEVAGIEVLEDKPCIELIPIENIRFDAGAEWTNIVGSSPYVIRLVPMYVDSVLQQMEATDSKTGQPKWKKYSEDEIRVAMTEYDSIRQSREHPKADPLTEKPPLKSFEIVWVHENFVRLEGEEMVYWTLGTQHLLSEPVKLKEAYFHGERPIVIGCAVLEAHKAIPDSLVAISSELQKEINNNANQRQDNVALVLNKRWLVKRGQEVDVASLNRNVAGGVTLVNNVETDVHEINWPDVTSSAFQEQDRLDLAMDELTGNFSQGSVMTNRKLNETVGGMEMMGQGANQLTEYLIHTFVETFVEPVLRQVVKLEQAYETDTVILGLAGQKAQLVQKYQLNQVTDDLLNQSLTVRVNVGLGATDPQKRLGKFIAVLRTYAEVMQLMPDANPEAMRREMFGLAGYKDGNRFFKEGPGIPPQVQQQMQEMQGVIQELQAKLQDKSGELQLEQGKAQSSAQLEQAKAATSAQLERDKAAATIQLARETAAAQFNLKRMESADNIDLKRSESALSLDNERQKITMNHEIQREKAEVTKNEKGSSIVIDTKGEVAGNLVEVAKGQQQLGKAIEALLKAFTQSQADMSGALKELAEPKTARLKIAKQADGSYVGEKIDK